MQKGKWEENINNSIKASCLSDGEKRSQGDLKFEFFVVSL